MFRALATSLPNHQFAWVPGWDVLRGLDGGFDPVICEAICRTIDVPFLGGVPAQVPMDLPNITQLEQVNPPRPIFQRTRIVLVPSRWEEAFGRVAVEAMLFNVPVIGSRVGGLTDIVEHGGGWHSPGTMQTLGSRRLRDWMTPITTGKCKYGARNGLRVGICGSHAKYFAFFRSAG